MVPEQAQVQLKEGSCFLSLLKMVPADSGQRGATRKVVRALFRTHPMTTGTGPVLGADVSRSGLGLIPGLGEL